MRTSRSRFTPRTLLALAALAIGAAACSNNDSTGPTPPPAPSGLTVTQVTLTKVNLSWTASTGATDYFVQRTSSQTPGTFSTIKTGLAATTYTDSNLTPGVAYGYRVAAVAGADTSAFSTVANFGFKVATINGNITANRTFTSDTTYILSGYIKVQNGVTLTIQPGTLIIGDTTVVGSSLWILRGAKIIANGTAAAPIVFTSARSPGNRKPGDWGGIIIVGNGKINRTGSPILTEGGAAGQAVDYSGGNNDADSSGVLRYVRIEFAGFDVSNGAGQELNSLSSYAVGSKTVYEYLQTMSGLDDSYEWWGGAVDGRYLVSYESGDDHFDWTEGYHGRNQFLIAFQTQKLNPAPGTGVFSTDPRGFEGDGCDPAVSGCVLTATSASTPYSMPVFANFTMIGPNTGLAPAAGIPADGNGGVWRRGTGGTFRNGILSRWKGIAINVRDAWTDSLFTANGGKDSLDIQAVILTQNGFNLDTTGAGFAQTANWVAGRVATLKQYATTVLADTLLGINVNSASLDWTPKAGSPASSGAVAAPAARVAGYFGNGWVNTTFLGAADPAGAKWWAGWTVYYVN